MIKRSLFVFFLALLFAAPLLVIVIYSISSTWQFPNLLPDGFSIRALRYVEIQLGPILTSLATSLVYSLLTVLATFSICVLPAGVFARRHFKYKALLEAALLAPALVPSITFTMGIHYIFILARLTDSIMGIVVILTIFSYPYMLRALTAGFVAYGGEYDVCAQNLGANLWMRLLRVELPLLLPSIVSGGTIVFLVAFSEYFLVFIIGGGAVPSFTGYLFPFLNSSDRPVASILTLVFILIPIILFAVVDLTVNRIYRKKGML